jgi:hypothetical protein
LTSNQNGDNVIGSKRGLLMTDIAEAIEHIRSALSIIAAEALDPDTYAEVAAEKVALGQIRGLAELILSFIDSRNPTRTTVGRMQ